MRWLRLGLAVAAPTARAARRKPFLAAVGVGFAIIAVTSAMSVSLGPDDLITLLRLAAVCAGVGVVFLLDDPAKPTTATTPAPAGLTTAVRVVVALLAASVWWAGTLAVTVAGAQDGVGAQIPLRGVTIEAATIVAAALVLAVFGWRSADRGIGSTFAGPALLVTLATVMLLAGRQVLAQTTDPRWASIHRGWAVSLGTLLVAVVLGVTAPHAPEIRLGRPALRRTAAGR